MNIFQYNYSPFPKLALALLAFSLASFTRAAKSELIVIDNFSVNTQGALIVDHFDTFDSQTAQTSGYIKGNAVSRDINLTSLLNTDEDGIDRSIARISAGLFKWSNDSGVQSTTTMNHQFSAIDVTDPTYGVTEGNLILDVTNVDLGAEAVITLIDSNNESATVSFTTTFVGAQVIKLSYLDFIADNSNLDFTQIETVSTTLNGPVDVDFQMRTLAFSTPEPSSIMLFSLAGIGFASRRRRKRS